MQADRQMQLSTATSVVRSAQLSHGCSRHDSPSGCSLLGQDAGEVRAHLQATCGASHRMGTLGITQALAESTLLRGRALDPKSSNLTAWGMICFAMQTNGCCISARKACSVQRFNLEDAHASESGCGFYACMQCHIISLHCGSVTHTATHMALWLLIRPLPFYIQKVRVPCNAVWFSRTLLVRLHHSSSGVWALDCSRDVAVLYLIDRQGANTAQLQSSTHMQGRHTGSPCRGSDATFPCQIEAIQ